ncbi:MAG: hypothetical protein M3Z09_03260 [Acidobacteriota bacterium]|nr:hypothetical protein [Acidobacteriota bacterium]
MTNGGTNASVSVNAPSKRKVKLIERLRQTRMDQWTQSRNAEGEASAMKPGCPDWEMIG